MPRECPYQKLGNADKTLKVDVERCFPTELGNKVFSPIAKNYLWCINYPSNTSCISRVNYGISIIVYYSSNNIQIEV